MSRRKWTLPPGSVAHPGALETPTLANLARRPSPRRKPQCRICLADDDVKDGICRDRGAIPAASAHCTGGVVSITRWIFEIITIWLALIGLAWVIARMRDGLERAWDWWRRDRVTPLLEDDDLVDDPADLEEYDPSGRELGDEMERLLGLPPERTWEQMTSHQLPTLSRDEYKDWQRREDARRQQARRVEMTHRAHYAAMRMDYPSGLMARVRELTP